MTDLWLSNLFAYSVQVAATVFALTAMVWLFQVRSPKLLLMSWQILLVVCLLGPLIQPYQSVLSRTALSPESRGLRSEVHLSRRVYQGPSKLANLLPWILIGGGTVRLGWLAVGLARLRVYRRRAWPLNPLPETWKAMEVYVGVSPKVYLSGDLSGPATTGLPHPIVLLPEDFLEMPAQHQRAIACHELWHVRRRDYLFALVEEALAALLWFHPAIWWILNRIRLYREQVVDRLVVETTDERKAYLEALLQSGLNRWRTEVLLAPLFLRRHHLAQRVTLILSEVGMSKTRLLSLVAILSTAFLVTGVLVVKLFPLQSVHSRKSEPVAGVRAGAGSMGTISVGPEVLSAKLMHRVEPEYPPEASEKGIEGQVQLQILIDEEGQVAAAQVLGGDGLLAVAATEAVRQWQYLPFLLDGKPVRVNATVAVDFSLPKSRLTQASKSSIALPIKTENSPPVYKVGNGVVPPRVLSRIEPHYTEEARDAKLQGVVALNAVISAEGVPQNIQVTQGLGMGLDESAVQAISQWRFAPATLNGAPVPVAINVEVNFTLR
jgi:TonB family protein